VALILHPLGLFAAVNRVQSEDLVSDESDGLALCEKSIEKCADVR
jgi:hypothetical protein